MARSMEQILNELNEAEAELAAMAGYEEQYPEHYDNLVARWHAVKREYDQAVAAGRELMSIDPELVCIGGGKEDEPRYSNAPGGGCPIAGEGDPICLTDPDEYVVTDQQTHEDWIKQVELAIVGPVTKVGTRTVTAYRDVVPQATRARFSIRESDGKGSDSWIVSNHIGERFQRLVQRINDLGARISSGGGLRPIDAKVSQGRSAKSFHYSGVAIDLFPFSGTLDKETDLFVVTELNDEFRYRVYYRYRDDDSIPRPSLGPITTETLENVCTFDPSQQGIPLVRKGTTTGTFLNLTALFEEEGFRGIRSQQSFRKDAKWSNRLSMEWWHFEYTDHLQVGTLFGKVLLEMHSYDKARWCPPWSFYDARFKRSGDGGGSFSY